MLHKEEAAEYCRIPRNRFDSICPILPIKLHESLKPTWDKHDLDKWIDNAKRDIGEFNEDKILERLG